jgi:hypothetical protein
MACHKCQSCCSCGCWDGCGGYGGGYGCDDSCGGHGAIGHDGGAIIGGHGGTVIAPGGTVMPPAGESIKLPKDVDGGKKPSGGGTGGGTGTPGKTQAPTSTLEVTPTSSKAVETETKNPFELDRRYETRVDRAADYSWVTGQLFYVHADGGLWVLRYAPLAKEDAHGGSVILARDRQMDSYREGDLVTVHGEILKQKGSLFLGGPLYRATSIQLIDRAQR